MATFDGVWKNGPVRVGAEHAILRGLREPGSETEVTRVLAAVMQADRRFAAEFVRLVLMHSKRAADPRWGRLPDEFDCRSEVLLPEGRIDLEFSDLASGWRVLVELKIAAGYGFDQIERYLRCLDVDDKQQVLVSITRDVPKYGDPPIEGRANWAGSVPWSALIDGLRALEPTNPKLAQQWPLLLDVLESEGSMGVTKVRPELLRTWATAVEARKQAVAFMEGLRSPLLMALQEALEPAFPRLERDERASVTPAPSNGRSPQVNVEFFVPHGGEMRASAQLWAWEDFRFAVSARYPAEDRSAQAKEAIARLATSGFENWKNRWLWRSLPLGDGLLESSELEDKLLTWSRESFDQIAESRIFVLDVEPLPPEDDEP
jgi:hypothetical protein